MLALGYCFTHSSGPGGNNLHKDASEALTRFHPVLQALSFGSGFFTISAPFSEACLGLGSMEAPPLSVVAQRWPRSCLEYMHTKSSKENIHTWSTFAWSSKSDFSWVWENYTTVPGPFKKDFTFVILQSIASFLMRSYYTAQIERAKRPYEEKKKGVLRLFWLAGLALVETNKSHPMQPPSPVRWDASRSARCCLGPRWPAAPCTQWLESSSFWLWLIFLLGNIIYYPNRNYIRAFG